MADDDSGDDRHLTVVQSPRVATDADFGPLLTAELSAGPSRRTAHDTGTHAVDEYESCDHDSKRGGETSSTAVDAWSFDAVYEQHHRFVWRVLRAYGFPPEAAEDAAQDVFVIVHRRLPDFRGSTGLRAWLFQITRWVVVHERRRFRTKPEHEPIDDALRDAGPGPFEMTARTQALRTIEATLNRMDEDKRLVFVLMDIEEMKALEVADMFSINVNTVYSRLRLAREQFRRLLDEHAAAPQRNEP